MGDGELDRRPGRATRGDVLSSSIAVIALIVGVLWAAEAVDVVLSHRLDRFGVRPHTLVGLRGIVLAPFLHAGFGHLISNTVPLAAMGWLVLLGGAHRFAAVTVSVVCISGAGIWLFGTSDQVHIGASGVVFGYLGYLVSRGFFERRARHVLVGLVVLALYGGILWGVFPTARGVSWQGHLFGFLGGVLAAKTLASGDETAVSDR